MRIALLTYSTKPRGSVIHTLELADALQDLGHSVCIYALDKDGAGFERPPACRVKLVPALPAPADIDVLIQQRIGEFVAFLASDLQHSQFDIFHAQDCISANALAALRQQGSIAHFVRTVHHIEDYASPYLQQCQERSIRSPNLCFCVSEYWQQQLLQQYGIDAPRVINGVNCDRFTPIPSGVEADLKAAIGIGGTPVYLTVGGIEPRKNTVQLLKAFAQVRSRRAAGSGARSSLPQAQLIIAGGATLFDYQPYRDEFFRQAAQLNLPIGESLLLPGVLADADLPALYRCADAFVFPSIKEGWGLVVLEAIASGLPTIVSHQVPFTEFLTPKQTLFVQPNDPDSIAQAMLKIVHPPISQALIQNSRSILPLYSWSTSAKMHLQHYHALQTRESALPSL